MSFQVWLVKSEPSSYSIDDLKRDRVTAWGGVRNYQARNFIRDGMRVGDKAFFYHSNAGEGTGIVGLCEVVSEAYPDETAFDPSSIYYDPASDRAKPRWYVVDVAFVSRYVRCVGLHELRTHDALAHMGVLKKGNRLSITPVSMEEYVCVQSIVG
jgi:predicted RNA-binding protein with PUA-like domain